MKVPLTLFSLIPSSMLSFYIKYILALENWTSFESYTLATALVGGLLSIPLTVKMAPRFGKGTTLAMLLGVEAVLFIAFACIP